MAFADIREFIATVPKETAERVAGMWKSYGIPSGTA